MKLPVARVYRALPLPVRVKWRRAMMISRSLEADESHWAMARMREGFRMSLNLGESYERTMYYSGLYHPWLTHIFKRILRPGDTMVDGGANVGYFSLLAARRVGPGGAVHSFEPIPATFAQFNQNITLNGYTQITANCLALATSAGQVEFEIPQETGTNQSLGRMASAVHTGRGPRVGVQTCTLDAYAAEAGIESIKLAKFDLEGGEIDAIKGMQSLLGARQIEYLICELNLPLIDQQGLPHSALRDALASYGYEAYYIKCTRGYYRPLRVQFIPIQQMPKPDITGDYFFVAPGRPVPQMHRT